MKDFIFAGVVFFTLMLLSALYNKYLEDPDFHNEYTTVCLDDIAYYKNSRWNLSVKIDNRTLMPERCK